MTFYLLCIAVGVVMVVLPIGFWVWHRLTCRLCKWYSRKLHGSQDSSREVK
jgi:hypothetical protein